MARARTAYSQNSTHFMRLRPDSQPIQMLPAMLKAPITRFPPGTLQFEIGIQTFDVATQRRISRRQDNAAANALYQAAGYRPLAALPGYYEDGAAGWRYGRDWSRA